MITLNLKPRFMTFDCYGTLVQWHQALHTAVRAIFASHEDAPVPDEGVVATIVDALRTASMELQQHQPYREYKTILRSSLGEAMASQGLSLRPDDGETLLSHLRTIPPHPEVPAVLKRLSAQFRLAIISNTDDDLIAGTVAAIGVPIDFVVTAQQARAYKPDHRLFRHALATIGATPGEILHVGMGQITDLKVCHELGIRVVWIDRLREHLNPLWPPSYVLPDISGLPALLD